jgi:hypothetical protein
VLEKPFAVLSIEPSSIRSVLHRSFEEGRGPSSPNILEQVLGGAALLFPVPETRAVQGSLPAHSANGGGRPLTVTATSDRRGGCGNRTRRRTFRGHARAGSAWTRCLAAGGDLGGHLGRLPQSYCARHNGSQLCARGLQAVRWKARPAHPHLDLAVAFHTQNRAVAHAHLVEDGGQIRYAAHLLTLCRGDVIA